jgi:hypothetical protein
LILGRDKRIKKIDTKYGGGGFYGHWKDRLAVFKAQTPSKATK